VYSDQLKFLSKLISEKQTDDSLSVDNIEESQVEQNRDDMQNSTQEIPFQKPRTEQCGKRKRKPDEFELRIIKVLEEGTQPNRHLSFFKGIIPSLENFNEEETLEFQMGILQLVANIKNRKPTSFCRQPVRMYDTSFHTSSQLGPNNPLLVYASTMNPHHSTGNTVQPLALHTGMLPPSTMGHESVTHITSQSPPTARQYGQYYQQQASSSKDSHIPANIPSPSLSTNSVSSDHTDCSIDFTSV
jgi:hypothetical protein